MSIHTPTVFNQIFWLVRTHFESHLGQLDKYSKVMDTTSLAKVLLYAQITGKESLRDIVTWLECHEEKRYHMGLNPIKRSTLAYWNNKVDSSVYEKVFYALLRKYHTTFTHSKQQLWIKTIALDWSIISLALSMYDWAQYRTAKWWIKLHVGMDVEICMPEYICITDAKQGENIIAKTMVNNDYLKRWEMIVFDRYYVDFELWKMIDDHWAYFVTRTKSNTDYVITKHFETHHPYVLSDTQVELMWMKWRSAFTTPLRVVKYFDKENERVFTYITNNFTLTAELIANIYKNRWRIEEFFRRIKQNLKIKSFLWTTENAVKNQIWIAMIYYVLLHYLRSIANLWRHQCLKLIRMMREYCMRRIGLTEVLAMGKSKTQQCITSSSWPPNTLFDY